MKDIIEDVNKIYGLDHKQVNSMGDSVRERIYALVLYKGANLLARKYLMLS